MKKVSKKKWFCNMLLGTGLLAVLLVLCGFSGGGVNCSGVKSLDYTLGAAEDYLYPAYESGEGNDQTLTLYVPLGQETQIPLKAVITPAEGFTMTDFGGEDAEWSFSADAMPEGLILGASTVQETENNLVVTAVVTVSAQTVKKDFGAATVTLTTNTGVGLSAPSVQLKVTAMDLACSLCGGEIQQDGTYAHKTCEICGAKCDGTVYEHKTCEICGAKCDGTTFEHKTCEICGAKCDGTTFEHKTCEICGAKCDGTTFEHKTCAVCGGKCNGMEYEHNACKVCGGKCNGTEYVHKKGSACTAVTGGNTSDKNNGTTSGKTEEKKETAKVAKTGDYADIALYSGLVLAAVIVMIMLAFYKKKCTK